MKLQKKPQKNQLLKQKNNRTHKSSLEQQFQTALIFKLIMKKAILFFVLISLSACKINECEDIDCFTPPPSFIFELVDKTTGENLFTTGVLDSSTIEVLDEDSNKTTFSFITEDGINLLQLTEIGWNLGLHTYTVSVGTDVEFSITLEMEEKHENCCTFFNTLQFNVSTYEFEQSTTSGIYTIKID